MPQTLEELLAQYLAKSTFDEDQKGVARSHFNNSLDTYKWLRDNQSQSSVPLEALLLSFPTRLEELNTLFNFYTAEELALVLGE
jgi:hypothetical protein